MEYYNSVRHLLGKRTAGFDFAFKYLQDIDQPTIYETGCARQLDNFSGDGQSSLLFDAYVKEYGGYFVTVDISEESVNYCKSRMKSNKSRVELGDSITFLNKIVGYPNEAHYPFIDFLYLDSFDAPQDNPEVLNRSGLHHLYELATILPLPSPGCLIGVDDNWLDNGVQSGKGKYVYDYFKCRGIMPVFNEYQIFWVLP